MANKRKHKQSRKVRFAEPVSESRAVSPADAIKEIAPKNVKDLEPPFSLIAHLDLAAKKLKDDKESSVKTIKSVKSTKSVKSNYHPVKETKGHR